VYFKAYLTLRFCVGVKEKYRLPPSRERWLTAAITFYTPAKTSQMLICGDRVGNIHVYTRKSFDVIKNPIQTLHRIHGTMGVQSFHIFRKNLVTSGRDGMLRFYQIREEDTEPLLVLHKKKMPMDWVSDMIEVNMERAGETKKDENFFVFGFKQV
jgi:hypothetical protein